MIPLDHVIGLSAILFAIGVIGVVTRRNLIVMLMSIELMLNAVNLTFVAAGNDLGLIEGQVAALFVIVVAAAEVTVGLAILIAVFRYRATADVDDLASLKG
jgi:NADH-quinone oxidoreductase subunit K